MSRPENNVGNLLWAMMVANDEGERRRRGLELANVFDAMERRIAKLEQRADRAVERLSRLERNLDP